MTLTLLIGLAMLAIALPFVFRRVLFLYRLITSGQPAPDRSRASPAGSAWPSRPRSSRSSARRSCSSGSVPGAAHFFVFWAFLILGTVYVEAYGVAVHLARSWRDPDRRPLGPARLRPGLHRRAWPASASAPSRQIRLQATPRASSAASPASSGSHLGGAWLVLFMIFNVIWTMFLFRGAAAAARQPALRQRRVRLAGRRQPARRPQHEHPRGPRGRRPAAAHRRHAGVPRRSC